MLIVPGIINSNIPKTLYNIFMESKFENLTTNFLLNFYSLQNGNFFIILLIQNISIGFLGSMIQFGVLFWNYFSPSCFLFLKKKHGDTYQKFLNTESTSFSYGYTYSLNLTILGIIFVYSIHIPLVVVFGILYFFMRLFVDCHLLMNVFGKDIESSGSLVQDAVSKMIFNLAFFQFCLFFKVLANGFYLSAFLIFSIFVFTVFFYFFNQKKFLNIGLYEDYNKNHDLDIKGWVKSYSHPLCLKYVQLQDHPEIFENSDSNIIEEEDDKFEI